MANEKYMKKEILSEISFRAINCNLDNKYLVLKKYAKIINMSNILGEGLEHDSTHYIENTYYKWGRANSRMKLYFDYYKDDTLCLDIYSDNRKVLLDIIHQVSIILQDKTKNMNINQDWGNENVLD